MHLRRVTTWDLMEATEKGVNMTDYSCKNALRPTPTAAAHVDLIDALQSLQTFGQHMHNDETMELISTALSFVTQYGDLVQPDAVTCRLLVSWVNSKFTKFQSLLISDGLHAAVRVKKEFNRSDDALTALREYRQEHHGSMNEAKRTPNQDSARRRQTKAPPVPPNVIKALPKDGAK
uniref:Uncharacterized protein n=1 Tax=Globisporangium ultimum (strain ATCC 200006 / CBS 805.95 / DAOM BR144) TaxID=431595 RepID=K3WCP1_GLOUD